jgi:hypothetical protein
MPIQDYNPVMRGLTTAYEIAQRMQSQRLQQAEFERLMQQMEYQQEQQAYQRERNKIEDERQKKDDQLREADLRMKMLAGGIREATPGDLAASTAQRFRIEGDQLVPTGQVGTSIANQMFDYNGKRMVAPTPEETLQRKVDEAKLFGDAETMSKIKQAVEVQKALAQPLPKAVAEYYGKDPSEKIPKDLWDNAVSAYERAQTTKATNDRAEADRTARAEEGRLNRASREKTAAGRSITAARGAGGLSPASQATDARLRESAKRTRLKELEKEEQKLMEEVVSLRNGSDENGKPLTGEQVPAAAARIQSKTRRLQQIRKQKVELGFTTPEDAGLVKKPKSAAKVTVEGFKEKYGIK